MTNIITESNKFAKLFASTKKVKISGWKGNDSIGVSILKNYPSNGLFVPVKDRQGGYDTVVCINIFFPQSEFNNKEKKVMLRISAFKLSHYTSKYHWYNPNDKNCPSELSIKKSNLSTQPITIEENTRYEYHIKNKKIFDIEANKYIATNQLIENIYKVHLKTITDKLFRFKMKSKERLIKLIDPTNNLLKKINYYCFGKSFKKSSGLDDYFLGIYKTYKKEDLIDLSITSEKPKILGSDFPITYQSATIFFVLMLSIFLINYWFKYDIFGIVNFTVEASKNSLFLASLVTVTLIVIDRVIPFILLIIMNILIKLRIYLTLEHKIKIK